MAVSDEFLNHVLDQLSRWGGVSVRRMFGGAGLYRDGRMFGLIAADVVYLKVDDASRPSFIEAGSAPFNPYPDQLKATVLSYFEIPPEILEHRDLLAQWAQRALEAQVPKSKRVPPHPARPPERGAKAPRRPRP